MPKWANNRKKERGLGNANDRNSPLFQVAQSDTIETVRTNGCHTAEDDQSAWAAEWQVSFVFHVCKPASWGHIPVKSQSMKSRSRRRGGTTTSHTHCLYGLADTAAHQNEPVVSTSRIGATGKRPVVWILRKPGRTGFKILFRRTSWWVRMSRRDSFGRVFPFRESHPGTSECSLGCWTWTRPG